MNLRREQIEVFRELMSKRFEDRMVAHLERHFPEQCRALGEAGTREAIQYGIEQAASYRIVAERDVCKYIDVMFAYGRDFDTDPKLPWAGAILRDETLGGPRDRVDRLCSVAIEHLDAR